VRELKNTFPLTRQSNASRNKQEIQKGRRKQKETGRIGKCPRRWGNEEKGKKEKRKGGEGFVLARFSYDTVICLTKTSTLLSLGVRSVLRTCLCFVFEGLAGL